jgi:hypothetical protein
MQEFKRFSIILNLGEISEINVDNLNISGIKRGNVLKTKLMSLQRTVRTRTSETCIGE